MASENENKGGGGGGESVILLDFWPSMFAMRVKIALAEKGVTDYVIKEENIQVSKSPLLLQMNPVHKKVPVLIHNGKPVCESMNIVEYIDQAWPHNSPPLLPDDPYLKANAKFWAHFVDTKLYPAQYKAWTTTGETQEEAKTDFIDILKTLENELGNNYFFGGDHIGFLDIAIISFYSWFRTYEFYWNISFEAECPKFIAWAKRCLQKDSVSNSLADMDKISEAVLEFRKIKGLD